MFEISDKTPQRALEESNNKNIEVVREKYLQPILEVLDRKNIKGSRLLKQRDNVPKTSKILESPNRVEIQIPEL